MENNEFKVQSNTNTLNIKTLCSEIDLGESKQGGIRLKPFYQREYKFTKKDESFLIESLLMGIPIPTIYLASDVSVSPHTSNVIDGQHRLKSIHRFINNKYQLVGLENLSYLNGKGFNDLPDELKNKLLVQTSLTVNYIHIEKNNPSLELEIFLRYNRGTNPMTKQDIRHVLFGSEFNNWVISLADKLQRDKTRIDMFSITTKRRKDRSVHSDICLMFSILHYGLNPKFAASTYYVDEIMSKAKEMSPDEIQEFIKKSDFMFQEMKKFLHHLKKLGIKHPFSKDLYAPHEQRRCFQTSILMIMTDVIKTIIEKNYDFKNTRRILEKIKSGFYRSDFRFEKSATTRFELVNGAANSIKEQLQVNPVNVPVLHELMEEPC